MQYTNKPIDYAAQLNTLKRYGLKVNDDKAALDVLRSISYFRLVCYLKCFEQDEHQYRPGTLFENGVMLYSFDNELKAVIYKAIQDVEIALRTRMVHFIGMEQGAFWFMNANCFNDPSNFKSNLEKLKTELDRSNEDFIVEHQKKYSNPAMPPVWRTLEVASLGTLSKIYETLNTTDGKKNVARSFGLPQYTYLESWNRSMTVLRNCLAHHARVWNRRFSVKPQLPKRLSGSWIGNATIVRPHKLYTQLCVLAYMEQTVAVNCGFVSELKSLLERYPMVEVRAMGFPDDWDKEPLWMD